MKLPKRALLCSSLALALNVNLPAANAAGLTVTPMLGVYDFDDDTNLKNSEFGLFALGYRFNNPWQIELSYSTIDGEIKGSETEVDVEEIKLDALYHFWEDDKAQPFLLFGVGQQSVDQDSDSTDNSLIELGLGLKYAVTDGLSLRTDLRRINDIDEDFGHFAWAAGLQYQFGTVSKPQVKTAPPKAEPADSDQDGVLDSADRCPGTPSGTQVDANGCPMPMDDDNDGVTNEKDQCPDSSAGAVVDEKGCYIVITETKEVALHVKFENNSFVVSPDSYSEIERVASFMTQYPLTKVTIEGHTDDRGAAAYNQQLSQKRAQAVADLLSSEFGIDSSRVTAAGFGESQPIASNSSAEGRAKNRRVTAKVSAQIEKVKSN